MINLYKIIYKFFDKLEDKIRGRLTHTPLIYAFVGSVGIVSIWRGVELISDNLGMPGWLSLILGIVIATSTGLFVSFFIGENIIISGLNKEKRTDEKTEEEIHEEREEIHKERTTLIEIQKDIKEIKEFLIMDSNKKPDSK
jgi:hypothetical protein